MSDLNPPQLIALYAPVMQSGKTQIANVLQLSHEFRLVKFADPIKDIIRGLLKKAGAKPGLIERMMDGDLKEQIIPSLGKSVRSLHQTLGDWGRNVHPDFWVNLAMPQVDSLLASGFSVVMDDLRYPNEYEAVIARAGHPVGVYRRGSKPYTEHRSEGLLEGYPMTRFHNNAGLAELRLDAERLPGLLRG